MPYPSERPTPLWWGVPIEEGSKMGKLHRMATTLREAGKVAEAVELERLAARVRLTGEEVAPSPALVDAFTKVHRRSGQFAPEPVDFRVPKGR